MLLEFALCIGLIVVAMAAVYSVGTGRRAGFKIFAVAAVVLVSSGLVWQTQWRPAQVSRATLVAELPKRDAQPEFVSSDACRSCHQQEYDSWHASYHRTMTRPATPENVIGNFEDQVLVSRGFEYRLSREGDAFWVDGPLPEYDFEVRRRGLLGTQVANPELGRYRIVMTTGKHHWQTYWVAGDGDHPLINFPFVFLVEQDRWLPRELMFLKPPGYISYVTWNTNCLPCHATAGQPGRFDSSGQYATQVAELGISCEACHGPAAAHVAANRDPSHRYRQHLSDEPDPTIVQPKRLDQQASADVCGQCHGIAFPMDYEQWQRTGHTFRAGDKLKDSRLVLVPNQVRDEAWWATILEKIPNRLEHQFWSDGMARVTGREYPAMVESPCFKHGTMTCLSCHSMHHSDPNDQLAAAMDSNQACLQCHTEYAENLQEHTHHAADSSGSACYNCHMPHTSYGLLKAARSHQIDVPDVGHCREVGRPNACNLCHVDQSLGWTADHLTAWYGQQQPDLNDEERTQSAGILWLLTGDAGQRALVAWAMGWPAAQEASDPLWMAPLLAATLDDPYSAVRYIAGRSLESLPDFDDIGYDFAAPSQERRATVDRVLVRWQKLHAPQLTGQQPRGVLTQDGQVDFTTLNELLSRRDNRPLDLVE